MVKKLEALGKADPRIQRIRTIPGVGPRTAEILVACIDDPHRFNNGREVSAYFGLVPRQYQSGETDRICGKQKTRKKKAAVALARKIAVLAWAMLRDEKDWEPKHMIQVTESFGKMKRELKQSLQSMKPKENSDQRKSRLRREAREAKAVAERPKRSVRTATARRSRSKTTVVPTATPPTNTSKRATPKPTTRTNLKPKPKPRRAGKLVSAV